MSSTASPQAATGGLPVLDQPAVYVIHENPDWFGPFAAAFDALDVPYVEWLLTGGELDLAALPPQGVFWSRFSASSHTRGNDISKDHTRSVLSWLEAAGRRTVNGRGVVELEVSKVAQLTALQAAGIDTPRTTAVFGSARLRSAARDFAAADPSADLLLKHNQGGKGLGVRRFTDLTELDSYLDSPEFEEPVDGITLLQEYIAPIDGTITRVEIVGGELVYAIRADTTAGGFQLCPADACAVDANGDPIAPPGAVRAPEPGEQIFSLREDVSGLPIEAFRAFLTKQGVEIAGIELIEAADGRIVTYDVNTNTNYNAVVEQAAPRSGPAAIADYLQKILAEQQEGL